MCSPDSLWRALHPIVCRLARISYQNVCSRQQEQWATLMASLQQRAPAAVACPTGRPSRMSSVAAASSSSTGLRSAAPARRQGGAARRTAALEVACSLNNSTGTVGEFADRRGPRQGRVIRLSWAGRRAPPPAAATALTLPARLLPAASPPPAGLAAPKPTKLEAREQLRLALPSKGRMAEDTLQLLKVHAAGCQQDAQQQAAATCLSKGQARPLMDAQHCAV